MPEHEHLIAELRQREAELVSSIEQQTVELDRLRAQLGSEVTDDEHDPEGTTLSAGWSLLEGVRRNAEDELAQVRAALQRADDGGYGICVRCGQAIPSERLQVRPMADRCVRCASTPP